MVDEVVMVSGCDVLAEVMVVMVLSMVNADGDVHFLMEMRQ